MNELATNPMEPIFLGFVNVLSMKVVSGVVAFISNMKESHDLMLSLQRTHDVRRLVSKSDLVASKREGLSRA